MPRLKQPGFTLIELIIVIAIIGILAAIAVPRFITQTQNARIAALNGLAGAINSTVELAQAEYVAEGNNNTSTATTITMNGTTVSVIPGTGRPVASATGIGYALQTVTGFSANYAPPVATYNLSPTVVNCFETYTDTTGLVILTTTGC